MEVSPDRRGTFTVKYTAKHRRQRSSIDHTSDDQLDQLDSDDNKQLDGVVKTSGAATWSPTKHKNEGDKKILTPSPTSTRKAPHVDLNALPGPTPKHKRAPSSQISHHGKTQGVRSDVLVIQPTGDFGSRGKKDAKTAKGKAKGMKQKEREGSPWSAASATSNVDGNGGVDNDGDSDTGRIVGMSGLVAEAGPVRQMKGKGRVKAKAASMSPQGGKASEAFRSAKHARSRSSLSQVDISPFSTLNDNQRDDDDGDASSVTSHAPSHTSTSSHLTASHYFSNANNNNSNFSVLGKIGKDGKVRRTAQERKRLLEEDVWAGEVREFEVFCVGCEKWVRLGGGSNGPSKKVREAERKLALVNDPLVGEFAKDHVVCRKCNARVEFAKDMPWDVEVWVGHKSVCTSTAAEKGEDGEDVSPDVSMDTAEDEGRVDVAPQIRSTRIVRTQAPPSTASVSTSTESTAINAPSPGSVAGVKRRRGELDGDEGEMGNANTTREEEEPEAKRGRWSWVWLPWETFKRGFAEGLSSAPDTST
ncbi:hypothetical protein BD410DRAFT_741983 [Rickenella mellea]|uniref:Uncharacterized protein n=1 Tax=Rickenella mellea TaxID=50990 RepID=A0A4Y7QGZ4_9AGAM|nr:hypothetical protein BD410DRAFT_741983 [Rickenella mellea]